MGIDFASMVVPLISSNPQIKRKIQGAFDQPIDYIVKCFSEFIGSVKSGPGLVDHQAIKQQRYMQVYNAGLRMGFSDWQSQICAADCAGYKIIDVANSFSQRRGWDCSIQEIQKLHDDIMPKFMAKGRQVGLFQQQQVEQTPGIPKMKETRSKGGQPPWRTQKSQGVSAPPPMDNN